MFSKPSDLNLNSAAKILCFYINATSQIQLVQLTNTEDNSFERIVFPGDRCFFEAAPDAQLEIHTGMNGNEILLERLACNSLQVQQELSIA